MKLRNKKTGEVYNACRIAFGESIESLERTQWKTLKEFNEDWEDYEEPKECEYWYIEADGKILQCHKPTFINHLLDKQKEIGNYFETREEAEKAVEKLKALKRLKDKGFRFAGWNWPLRVLSFEIDEEELSEETGKDIPLLFGGEECES